MLELHTEEKLRQEKIKFLSQNLPFITTYCSDSVKNYVYNLLTHSESERLILSNDDIVRMRYTNCDQILLYCVLYVCYREIDFQWGEFFHYIKDQFPNQNANFGISFNTNEDQEHFRRIRQCRPDQSYTYKEIQNIGLYNKNQNFLYSNYDDQEAQLYIKKELGEVALQSYSNLQNDQAKSDFFLIASLYVEGGVSVDVCAVAQSNISVLVQDNDLCLVYDDNGFHKKFISTFKHNKFVEYYLSNLIEKSYQKDPGYWSYSSREIFHQEFLDFFAFRYDYIKQLKTVFIPQSLYGIFVRDNVSEENLHHDTSALPFSKVSIKGIIRKNFISQQYKDSFVVSKTKDFYMPPSSNLVVIGKDSNYHLSARNKDAYSLPSLDVWGLNNVHLTGNGVVWYKNKFVDFDSYLNHELLHQTHSGFWKNPNNSNVTKVITDECVVAFSPGLGCYGHYIVDELPRLGLIKDYLGDKFSTLKVIVSDETPEWAKELLKFFLGIEDSNFLVFDHDHDVWRLEKVFLSSYPHKEYNFHNYIKEFYTKFSKKDIKPFRRICLSRKKWEKQKNHQRIFESQDYFEEMAVSKGFELVNPEGLSLREQIDLMSEVACQIGEHGSAQHASVYNFYGNAIVGTINPLTEVQSALGRIYNDKNIVCYATSSRKDEHHNMYYDVSKEILHQFFDQIEKECIDMGV